jgi:hypothetical protein
MPRRFYLDNPDSGVRVGEGVLFSDGEVALHLAGRCPATVVNRSIDGMLHRLAMTPDAVQWLDPEPVR